MSINIRFCVRETRHLRGMFKPACDATVSRDQQASLFHRNKVLSLDPPPVESIAVARARDRRPAKHKYYSWDRQTVTTATVTTSCFKT